ncbi:MAG: L-lysine 6-transaminase [Ignavibacteria bacterium]|nr:L-lysine 6-transaminase [Ignavibacteria bacterium]
MHDFLQKHLLYAGFDLILDLERSEPAYIYDSLHQRKILDMFTFFATMPLGLNHPKMFEEKFLNKLQKTAVNKPANPDFFTEQLADFVETFERVAMPNFLPHLFLIEGGALAIENALKVAFDWKVRKNFLKGYTKEIGHKVIHFKDAFHGRSGYTMSLTNTDPTKIAYFPKFNWPRITNPKLSFPVTDKITEDVIKQENEAINQIHKAIKDNKDDIACLIIEPIQAEGGDNHFRKEFFFKLREICDENEILLIFDEVQTGVGLTGKFWAYEHFVQPDMIAFGKKMQVCGIMVSNRIDDIEDNCFKKPYRINSTWGGNLTDMVRATQYLKIIEEENLIGNAKITGEYLGKTLEKLQMEFPQFISNARGLGLMRAIDLPNTEFRNEFRKRAFQNGLMILGCGTKSIRFRPRLSVTKENIDEAESIISKTLKSMSL